jgi:RNA polymerase sigma factor (sigma-70 family)
MVLLLQTERDELIEQVYENRKIWVEDPIRSIMKMEEDVEDVGQDVLLKLLGGAIEKYDRKRKLGPWIKEVSINTARDFLCYKKRRHAINIDGESGFESILHEPLYDNPLERLELTEGVLMVRKGICRLSIDDRNILYKGKYFAEDERNYGALKSARELGVSRLTFRNMQGKVLKRLKNCMGEVA